MFNKSTEKLNQLHHKITQLKTLDIPSIQLECQNLLNELELEQSQPFWKSVSNERLRNIHIRFTQISELADKLLDLKNQISPIKKELEQMLSLFKNESIDISDYGKLQYDLYSQQFNSFLASTHEADIIFANSKIQQIAEKIRLNILALNAFRDAEAVLKKIKPDAETAIVSKSLHDNRLKLINNQFDQESISDFKKTYQPLISKLSQPQPNEIKWISHILTEAHSWLETLPDSNFEQLDDIEKRHRTIENEWQSMDESEFISLHNEAIILLKSCVDQGKAIRDQLLLQLQNKADNLTQACGKQAEIDLRLPDLTHLSYERANEHIDWLTRYKTALFEFNTIADIHKSILEERLKSYCDEWKKNIENLELIPLTKALRQQQIQLHQQLDQLNDNKGAQDLLISLHEATTALNEIQNINNEAVKIREKLIITQHQLENRNSCLQSFAQQSGKNCKNLISKINSLNQKNINSDLDDILAEVNNIENHLNEIQQEFIDECHKQLEQDNIILQQLHTLLTKANCAVDPYEALVLSTDPEICVKQLLAQAELIKKLKSEVDPTLTKLQLHIDTQQQKIYALLNDNKLKYADTQKAEKLLSEFLHTNDIDSTIDRLEYISILIEKINRFWEDLHEQEKLLQQRLNSLKEQYELFDTEKLTQHISPELLETLENWIFGLPSQLQPSHSKQLSKAENMLIQLKSHANRQISNKIREQVIFLKEQHYQHANPLIVKNLLHELDDVDQYKLLPYIYRKQINQLAQEMGWQHG